MLFMDCDRDGDGFVEKPEFSALIDGYFNSKHQRAGAADYDEYFRKLDNNNDGKISFEDYDVFIRIVYETEYLPALERELARRKKK
jgi:Ca2+-binding EF-hand superfamily protein